jgi:hypothetical protein
MKAKLRILMIVVAMGWPVLHAKDRNEAAPGPELRVHPKLFSFVEGWLSDGESPIATEINLDAVGVSRNQFNADEVKLEEGWYRCPGRDGMGFLRYRVLESKGHHYKVEYQENGGGSLTTACIIECAVEKRDIRVDGKPVTIRVLHVLSFTNKP